MLVHDTQREIRRLLPGEIGQVHDKLPHSKRIGESKHVPRHNDYVLEIHHKWAIENVLVDSMPSLGSVHSARLSFPHVCASSSREATQFHRVSLPGCIRNVIFALSAIESHSFHGETLIHSSIFIKSQPRSRAWTQSNSHQTIFIDLSVHGIRRLE
jgi:hypothetical protein